MEVYSAFKGTRNSPSFKNCPLIHKYVCVETPHMVSLSTRTTHKTKKFHRESYFCDPERQGQRKPFMQSLTYQQSDRKRITKVNVIPLETFETALLTFSDALGRCECPPCLTNPHQSQGNVSSAPQSVSSTTPL